MCGESVIWVMWFVYILRSLKHPFIYVGFTRNVDKRLEEHNKGTNKSTKHNAPFILEAYIAVRTETKALALEKYLKTGSGKALLQKRFMIS